MHGSDETVPINGQTVLIADTQTHGTDSITLTTDMGGNERTKLP